MTTSYLAPGSRIGVYEIADVIGAGGMGVVYRAHDTRLGRDVAIKVLPPALAADPEALARFEREMRTLASLSHPHIVAIHDVGREGTTAYAVTELLEGESLAAVVARGPVPVRKALEYGVQIARALAAAHERSIIHRDIKPDNVFVTAEGHVKVLDFGLARGALAGSDGTDSKTMTVGTTPGMVMGTVGYMAPEQARGLPVDHRADIFAFGCLMYELVTGRRTFQRDSAADTLSAILKEDPAAPSSVAAGIPPALERVILRCLEKNPAERFQSARDLAFALEALSGPATSAGSGPLPVAATPRRTGAARIAAVALVSLALLAGAFALGSQFDRQPAPVITLKRLTFDLGLVRTARFTADGQTVVYGAAWKGAPLRSYVTRLDSAESRPLEVPDGDIHAVAPNGDMLLSGGRRYLTSWTPDGTLGRGKLFSSSVREVLEHVREADFLPNDAIAIVRRVGGRDRLEVPQGTVVFETPGYISHIRVAADGRRVAFLEHPLYGDNRGYVAVVEDGKARRLTPEYGAVEGLAWSADGTEIWYTGGGTEPHWMIMAIDARAATPRPGRVVWYVPADLVLLDIDARGQVLLSSGFLGGVTRASAANDPQEREIGLGFWTLPGRISRDGRTVLATAVDTVDPDYTVLTRRLDGTPVITLGSGRAQELSPDGRWGLSITPSEPQKVLLLPTGAGEKRQLDIGDLSPNVATFVPGGLRVIVIGRRGDAPAAIVVDATTNTRTTIDLRALEGRAFSRRRFLPSFVSPDGSLLAIAADDGKVLAWPLPNGGEAREIAALPEGDQFAGWTDQSSRVYVASWQGARARVDTLDLGTGRRTFFRDITADSTGMLSTPDLSLSADGRAYLYGFSRLLGSLYLVSGLR